MLLAASWLLLAQSLSLGQGLLGAACWAWPCRRLCMASCRQRPAHAENDRPVRLRLAAAARLVGDRAVDIVRPTWKSAARGCWGRRASCARVLSGCRCTAQDPQAVALLATIVSLTPGTVSSQLSDARAGTCWSTPCTAPTRRPLVARPSGTGTKCRSLEILCMTLLQTRAALGAGGLRAGPGCSTPGGCCAGPVPGRPHPGAGRDDGINGTGAVRAGGPGDRHARCYFERLAALLGFIGRGWRVIGQRRQVAVALARFGLAGAGRPP
jgi:multisubunit Na+/H+ antiporter MnhE subunit